MPSTRLPRLRQYQEQGIDFLYRYRRAILADEQGTGKTVQALVAAHKRAPDGGILVIAPKSAAGVWVDEAWKWLGIEALTYQGTNRDFRSLEGSIVITNYVLFREVIKLHPKWQVVIFDEAHRLRNRKRETLFKAALKVYAPNLFFLTGTPVFSNAGDLWPPLHLIDPKMFRSYWDFVKKWAYINYNGYGYQVEGVRKPESLQRMLRDDGLMLRRLKRDVMPELPPKTRMPVPIQMHPKQRKAYEQMSKDLMIELEAKGAILAIPNKLALFTRLRQLLVSPKLIGLDIPSASIAALKDELEESLDPVLVFTPFAEALPILAEKFQAFRQVFIVRGGMSAEAISAAVAGFQASEQPKVLLSSLLMGTSWTATEATQAYFLGYDWSPANNFQAEDRLHRFGQEHATTIKYFVHTGTLDEHIMDILDEKTTVAKLILDTKDFLLPRARRNAFEKAS